ncbi:TonB-dependent receptor [Opitutales bacterium]|nr:TonB-dependent receptor [Opitutales bacterium]
MIKFLVFSLLAGYSLFANAELEPMVVVETRRPQPLSEASPWVTRISGDDLEQRQIYNLSDALRSVPGMAVVRTGQMGSQTSLFSRGGASNHTAFIYEGRKLNGGFSGTYNLGELSNMGASSIEVLKGSSSINGAHAMGGTVHMRNELLLSDGYDSKVGFSYGSFDTLNSNFSTRFKNGNWAGNFSFSSLDTENDRPHSKFESLSSSFLIENQLTDGLSVNLLGLGYDNFLGSNFNKGFNVDPDAYQETFHFLISPQLEIETDSWDATLNYLFSEDELNYTPSYNMLYWTEQENVDFLTNHNLSDISSFQIGLGFSTSRFFRERNFVNSWGQNYASLGFLHEISNDTKLYGNLRFSDYSDFESSETYNFKVSKSLTSDLSIFAKFSTGFTPPEALDLYSYGVGYPGNPDLSAEESRNYELGFSKNDQASRNELKMTLFFTEYNNLILAPYGVVPENVRKSESIGIELWSHNQITQRVHLESSVSYAKSKNLDSNEDFLPKRPEFFGSVTATYSEDEFDVGTQMNFKNRTRESATKKNDDYFLVRLFGNYHISDQLTFNARIENLFDENYEEVIDYPALGRAAHAGLTYNF